MPTTHIHSVRSMKTRLDYVTYGKHTENRFSGENRALDQWFDLGDAYRTWQTARLIRSTYSSRKIEGYEVRVSWSPDELDPNKPDDVEKAMSFAKELKNRLFPNSPCAITAHGDGDGHCLHIHMDVVNHDMETDKCISGNSRNHKTVVAVSDALGKEWHMRKVEPRPNLWAEKQHYFESVIEDYEGEEKHTKSATRKYREAKSGMTFGLACSEVLQDESVVDFPSYEAALNARGITIERKTFKTKDGTEGEGFVYHGDVEIGGKTRKRRLKASTISSDFDAAHIDETIASVVAERKAALEQQQMQAQIELEKKEAEKREIEIQKKTQRKRKNVSYNREFIRLMPDESVFVEKANETSLRFCPKQNLMMTDVNKCVMGVYFSNVENALKESRGLLETPEMEACNWSLPTIPSDSKAFTYELYESYKTAAREVLYEDTDAEGKSFISAMYDKVISTAKNAWCRVIGFFDKARSDLRSVSRDTARELLTDAMKYVSSNYPQYEDAPAVAPKHKPDDDFDLLVFDPTDFGANYDEYMGDVYASVGDMSAGIADYSKSKQNREKERQEQYQQEKDERIAALEARVDEYYSSGDKDDKGYGL